LATKVAKAGLAATAALTRILELETEVGKLSHYVSVLSKRIHVMGKEAERKEENDGAEVASPVRVQEPEPQVVVESEVRMSGVIVVEDEEDVWVAPVAKPAVAESRVALVVDEPEVALVRLPKGKRRRTIVEEGSEVEESEKEGMKEDVVVPAGQRGGAPTGPRFMAERVRGARSRSGVPEDLFVRRAYRFVDRSLIEERNGMVGNTYYSRGGSARARGRGDYGGGGVGRRYRPYR